MMDKERGIRRQGRLEEVYSMVYNQASELRRQCEWGKHQQMAVCARASS